MDKLFLLHLSDIHISDASRANTWRNQLATDLDVELDIERLDYLIVSGDIANKSTPEEYAAAMEFLTGILERFNIEKHRVIVVPGNHDLNWDLSAEAYVHYIPKHKMAGEPGGDCIPAGSGGALKRDDMLYGKRFDYFSAHFYEKLTGYGYPPDPGQQAIIHPFPEHGMQYNLLIVDPENHTLTVETRKKEKPEGAWEADFRWGGKRDKKPYYVIDLKPTAIRTNGERDACETAHPLVIPSAYGTWILDECRDMNLTRMIGASSAIRASLPKIYIPIYAHRPEKERHGTEMAAMKDRATDIEDLIAEYETLVVEGPAGSGKTTLVRHFAYALIQGVRKIFFAEGVRKSFFAEGAPKSRLAKDILPVVIFFNKLREFDITGKPANAQTFEDLLGFYAQNQQTRLEPATVRRFSEAGKIVFLMDGLDEIDAERRKLAVSSLAAFRRKHPKVRACLSGRPHGIDETVLRYFGERTVRVLSLNMDQVREFIGKWFAHVYERESVRIRKTASEMIGEIEAHDNIRDLIDNPLMLTAVCLLYLDDRKLPEQRAELYDKIVDNLLYRRFDEPRRIRGFLEETAFRLHSKGVRGMDRVDAVKILETEFPRHQGGTEREYRQFIENRFDEIEPACALIGCEKGQYGFLHLTFQEFLAAAHLAGTVADDFSGAIQSFWENERFAEMIRLYIGLLSIKNRKTASKIADDALGRPDSPPFLRFRVAGRALLDIHRDHREPPTVETAKSGFWKS